MNRFWVLFAGILMALTFVVPNVAYADMAHPATCVELRVYTNGMLPELYDYPCYCPGGNTIIREPNRVRIIVCQEL